MLSGIVLESRLCLLAFAEINPPRPFTPVPTHTHDMVSPKPCYVSIYNFRWVPIHPYLPTARTAVPTLNPSLTLQLEEQRAT